jgi:hypothetical protein
MRKKIYQHQQLLYRYYKKFCNLQKRIRLMMQNGEFFSMPQEFRQRLLNRLKMLYIRMERFSGNQKLRWAGAVLAMVLSGSIAQAQFNDTLSLTGFTSPQHSIPAFGDIDNDGDQDILIGDLDGYIQYVTNNEGEYSIATNNPFDVVNVFDEAAPGLVDIDDDGDLDLFVGSVYGTFSYFRNDTGVFTEMFGADNPLDGIDIGEKSCPFFVDYDGDDDPDMVSGDYDGFFHYFENDGGTFTELVGLDNPFDGLQVGYYSFPCVVDLDDDGDLDLVAGDWYGAMHFFENNGGTYTEQTGTDNPFDGFNIGYSPTTAVLDVDSDGDLDLVAGGWDTNILNYFRNDGGKFTQKRGEPNPFEGLLGYGSAAPAFSDVDEDGDLDMLMGEYNGTLKYFENTGEGLIPRFGVDDPFDGFRNASSNDNPKPVFADVDNDGDEDLVIGDLYGGLQYFVKEDTNLFFEMTGADNPFDGIDIGDNSAPAFVDFDKDGDLDLFVGGKYSPSAGVYVGTLSYFRNVSGVFIQQTGTDNPFEALVAGQYGTGLNPVFHDVDRDGDEDLFIGLKAEGTIDYFWNDNGTYALTDSRNPFLDLGFGLGVAPTFADVDEDGDKDLYTGILATDGGVIQLSESTQGPPASVPVITANGINIYSRAKTIYIDAGEELLNKVEVYNLAGILITSRTVDAMGLYELNMPNTQSGLYLVRIISNGESSTDKVLIQ